MKHLLAIVAAVALGTLTSVAVAGERVSAKPTKLTAAQMDRVTAGALVDVQIRNVANNNNVAVPIQAQIPVSANACVLAACAQGIVQTTRNQGLLRQVQ